MSENDYQAELDDVNRKKDQEDDGDEYTCSQCEADDISCLNCFLCENCCMCEADDY